MSDARFPWFHCYQTKLLGALAGMEVDQGYLYCIVLFRIYEVSGPCTDTIEVLARRVGMRKARCQRALDWLLDKKKLYRVEGGLMNKFAEDPIATRRRIMSDPQKLNSWAGEKEEEKTPTNQKRGAPPRVAPTPPDKDRDIDRTSPLSGGGARAPVNGKSPRQKGTRLPVDWQPTEELIQYGIKIGFTRAEVIAEANEMKGWTVREAHRPITLKSDWKATFEGWLRRSWSDPKKQRHRQRNQPRPTMMDIATGRTDDDDEREPDR